MFAGDCLEALLDRDDDEERGPMAKAGAQFVAKALINLEKLTGGAG